MRSGATEGGSLQTLTGLNFGSSGRVFVGSQQCDVVSYNDSIIVFRAPSGQVCLSVILLEYIALDSCGNRRICEG